MFPVALATACPIGRLRNYMQRSLDHVRAMIAIGRNGDFALIPGLRKVYKSHRRSELIRLGLASDKQVRQGGAWGAVVHARLKTPEEVAASVVAAAELEAIVLAGCEPVWDEEFEEFDDDVSVIPAAAAAAACAAAFADVAAEAAEDEERDLLFALGGDQVHEPAQRVRTVGFIETFRLGDGEVLDEVLDEGLDEGGLDEEQEAKM